MKFNTILVLSAALSALMSCKNNNSAAGNGFNVSITPQAGTSYPAGTAVTVKAGYSASLTPDSVVYLLDSARIDVKKDSSAISIKTDSMKLGVKTLTVKVYQNGKSEEASTNIVLLAAKAPQLLTYKVVNTFAHDTTSFTEGLEYHDGYFYESDGGTIADGEGRSSLRKVELNTGKVIQKIDIDKKVFAEGITLIDNKIIQLTYHEKMGYIYDPKTFKRLSTFPFNAAPEGWGLCNNGKQLYATVGSGTGTNQIIVLNKNTYLKEGAIDVYDNIGPVTNLNELEFIDGKLYANIWQTDNIVVIDPKTGAITAKADMSKLYPDRTLYNPSADVLNGIAWDSEGKRLFLTGKKWDKLFEVKLSPVK